VTEDEEHGVPALSSRPICSFQCNNRPLLAAQ
jgi:hypothetical protein